MRDLVSKPKKLSALILDRDGTLNAMVLNPAGEVDSPYFKEQLELYPNLGSLLLPFVRQQIPIFIVTNQPGIAKGNFKREDLRAMHEEFSRRLAFVKVPIKKIFTCIHHPVGTERGDSNLIRDCDCRKPKPGMLLDLAKQFDIDLAEALMIGDTSADSGASAAAGVGKFLQVRPYYSPRIPQHLHKNHEDGVLDLETALKQAWPQ